MSVVVSPILYQGCKKKLIAKGLVKCFPSNIDTFYDLFSGSGIVSMNVKAKKYVLSDVNEHLFELYNAFKNLSSSKIINGICKRVEKYNLIKRSISNLHTNSESITKYKDGFNRLRKRYNKKHNIIDFITLMYYSFSQQFKFSNSGNYNATIGNRCFSDLSAIYVNNGCNFFSKDSVRLYNRKFSKINIDKIKKNDFVYLDPPYSNTSAVYNEKCGWTKKDDKKLFRFCEELNKRGIKFGISNVFENRGKKNKHLIKWCEKNNWYVRHFPNVRYSPCGNGASSNDEVFITNYSTEVKGTFD